MTECLSAFPDQDATNLDQQWCNAQWLARDSAGTVPRDSFLDAPPHLVVLLVLLLVFLVLLLLVLQLVLVLVLVLVLLLVPRLVLQFVLPLVLYWYGFWCWCISLELAPLLVRIYVLGVSLNIWQEPNSRGTRSSVPHTIFASAYLASFPSTR